MARDKLINLETADNHLFAGNKNYFTKMYDNTRKTIEKMYIKEVLPEREYTKEEIAESIRSGGRSNG